LQSTFEDRLSTEDDDSRDTDQRQFYGTAALAASKGLERFDLSRKSQNRRKLVLPKFRLI